MGGCLTAVAGGAVAPVVAGDAVIATVVVASGSFTRLAVVPTTANVTDFTDDAVTGTVSCAWSWRCAEFASTAPRSQMEVPLSLPQPKLKPGAPPLAGVARSWRAASAASPPVVQALTVHWTECPRSTLGCVRTIATHSSTGVLGALCSVCAAVGCVVTVAAGWAVTVVTGCPVRVRAGDGVTDVVADAGGRYVTVVLGCVSFLRLFGVGVGVGVLTAVLGGAIFGAVVGGFLRVAGCRVVGVGLTVVFVAADFVLVAVGLAGLAGLEGVWPADVDGDAVDFVGVGVEDDVLGAEDGWCVGLVGVGDGLGDATGGRTGSHDWLPGTAAALAAVVPATARVTPDTAVNRTLPAINVTVAGPVCANRMKRLPSPVRRDK